MRRMANRIKSCVLLVKSCVKITALINHVCMGLLLVLPLRTMRSAAAIYGGDGTDDTPVDTDENPDADLYSCCC